LVKQGNEKAAPPSAGGSGSVILAVAALGVLLVSTLLLAACGGAAMTAVTASAPVTTASPATTASLPNATAPSTTGGPATSLSTADDPNVKTAEKFVSLLATGDFAGAARQFDATMKTALPQAQLESVWQQLQAQAGAYRGQAGVRTVKQPPYDVVYVTIDCANSPVDVEIAFNSDGQISGLHFLPAGPDSTSTTAAYQAPAYVDQGAFSERSVTVGEGTEWALPGTLAVPKGPGPFPAVVLVQGSGPLDRDETVGPNRPFRDLAWGLASRGVAVLRYDKRTYAYPAQTASRLSTFTVQQESIDDALAAVKLLRGLPDIDSERIFVLGHSLGGTVAPRIAQQDHDLAGLIILAGATRPLEDLILEQERYLASLNGGPTSSQQNSRSELEAQVARVKASDLSPSTPAQDLPLGIPAAYWLDLRGYRPQTVAQALDLPLLVLQGGRDYQVTGADFAGWRSALSGDANAKLTLYPELNHLFATGTGKSTPSEYERPGHVAEQVIADIAAWIRG
jgi:uncharacterized protein